MNAVTTVRRGVHNPYTEDEKREIVEYVCSQLAQGRSVSKILREDPFMPDPDTWYRWLFSDQIVSDKVERAREFGASALVDEIVDIADDCSDDVYVDYTKDGYPVAKIDGSAVQRAKLQVYAREKYAAMIAPRRYGAKLDVTSAGNELKPAQVNQNKIEAIVNVAISRIAQQRRRIAEEE